MHYNLKDMLKDTQFLSYFLLSKLTNDIDEYDGVYFEITEAIERQLLVNMQYHNYGVVSYCGCEKFSSFMVRLVTPELVQLVIQVIRSFKNN